MRLVLGVNVPKIKNIHHTNQCNLYFENHSQKFLFSFQHLVRSFHIRASRHVHSLVKKGSFLLHSKQELLLEPAEVTMLLKGLFLALLLPALVQAQYENYSFKSFPQKDIMPLDSSYNYALEQYGAENWAESIKFLELSLRLHRLLRDSEAFCSRNCSSVSRDNGSVSADSSLRVMRHILLRAACLKKCKADFPVFKISYPRRDLLESFEKRVPYRYIQYAHYQVRAKA